MPARCRRHWLGIPGWHACDSTGGYVRKQLGIFLITAAMSFSSPLRCDIWCWLEIGMQLKYRKAAFLLSVA